MPLVTLPNPVLYQVSEPINFETESTLLISLLNHMQEVMKAGNGVGLAANQVGVAKRVIVLNQHPFEAVNPSYVPVNGTEMDSMEEGCLSDPGKRYLVSRPKQVWVEYYTRSGELKKDRFGGLKAKIWQHECDHINGINISQKGK
jgi:peptide deformylase